MHPVRRRKDQWRHLVHLVLHVLLKAAQETVGTLLKEGLAALLPAPVQEIEEKAEGEMLQTVRRLFQTVVALLRLVRVALRDGLIAAVSPLGQALGSAISGAAGSATP